MTINERIRVLRKDVLHKSQKDFAAMLKVTQASISWSEQPGNNIPDSTVQSICSIFKVNEPWLRTGEGEMYAELPEDDLVKRTTELLGAHDPLFETFVYMYSELSPESRAALLKKGAELFNDAIRRQKDKE